MNSAHTQSRNPRGTLFWRLWLRSITVKRSQAALAIGSLLVGAAVASMLLNLYGDVRRKMTREFRSFGANVVIAPAARPGDARTGGEGLMEEQLLGHLATSERRIELHHGRLTDFSVFTSSEEELIDNLLKVVWKTREDADQSALVADSFPEFLQNRATFLIMAQEELVKLGDGRLALTATGERRARGVIRRHRLAERLFFDTFGLEENLLDANACKIEHTLGPEVTEKICTFLKHPKTCPHGSPIPRGECCMRPSPSLSALRT